MNRIILFAVIISTVAIWTSCSKDKDVTKNDIKNNGGAGSGADEKIEVKDENLEIALIDLGLDDVLDGSIWKSKVQHVTELDISSRDIRDIDPVIRHFSSLKILNCSNNRISWMDLRTGFEETFFLPDLEFLDCSYNRFGTAGFRIAGHPSLKHLICRANWDYVISDYGIRIGFSLPNLEYLIVETVSLEVNVTLMPKLKYLEIVNSEIHKKSIDLSGHRTLETLKVISKGVERLDVSGCLALTHLEAGLSNNDNNRESVKVNNNPALKYIKIETSPYYCDFSINLNNMVHLEEFRVRSNFLSQLDFSKNTALKALNISRYPFRKINIQNGNNRNMKNFRIEGDFDCIQVDDVEWAKTNWTDSLTYHYTSPFRLNCF